MVLPLFDDNSDRQTFPYVNYALIAVNVFVFVVLQGMGDNDKFTYAWATVPEAILTGKDVPPVKRQDPATGDQITIPLQPTPISPYLTLLVSMFLHGGFVHLGGNMLFLWIFGDNVEDYLGHVRYLVFYLVCGVLASLAHVVSTYIFNGDTEIPSLGASGAISAVLGAYLLLFPQRRVTVLLFRILTQVPAYVAIGIWFVFQIVSGLGALGDPSGVAGVAYAAHVGGFLAGALLIRPFSLGLERPAPRRRLPYRSWQ